MSGKILVHELDEGIADLVVAVYDVDYAKESGTHTQILQRLYSFISRGTTTAGESPLEVLQWWDSLQWDRLGSVLTRQDGTFKLEFADDLFRRRDPTEDRPDYVLFVLGPEQPMQRDVSALFAAHPLWRLLHFSWVVRSGGGREESYVIRLAKAELEARGIRFGSKTGRGHASAVARAREVVASAMLARTEFATATEPVRTRMTGVASAAADLLLRARTREAVPSGRLFVAPGLDRDVLQRDVARDGIARLRGGIRVRLPSGGSETTVAPEDANSVLADPARSLDLTRTRSVLDGCLARHELRRLLTAAGVTADPPPGSGPAPSSDPISLEEAHAILLSRAVGQVADLPSAASRILLERLRSASRPDASTLNARIDELELRGGPADAVAYHDFHSLQIAFRSIWRRVFDDGLRSRGEELYERWVTVREYAGLGEPTADALAEIADLETFLVRVQQDLSLASGLAQRTGTLPDWDGSSSPLEDFFGPFMPPMPPIPGLTSGGPPSPPSPRDAIEGMFGGMFGGLFGGLFGGRSGAEGDEGSHRAPPSAQAHLLGRVKALTLDLARRLSEAYQFDVFEPGSYNFGLLTTYRQRWEPLSYQAGELVASIPLAPGEKRKYTTKQVLKTKREEQRAEASSSTVSSEASSTSRADTEIVNRASSTTNFTQSMQGTFGMGEFLSLTSTSQFSNNQERHSEQRKKDFRESVRKAADEYKQERKLEIKTSEELEATSEQVQEISNPNTEITVTYLFYELQRRYRVSERLHRVRPVILVAQEVPAPDRIDEGFLIAHEWILRRALLDPSLVPALDALTSEMPGDEFGVAVLRATWERNLQVVDRISMQLDARSALRDRIRGRVVELLQGVAEDDTGRDVAAAIFSGGLSLLFGGGEDEGAKLEAAREAADRELEFTESEMAETERRLKQAMSALEESTEKYVQATRAQLNRRTAVDQLRVHVKQNILYYMQAIWGHEPPDQRFFRLYDKPIDWFAIEATGGAAPAPATVETSPASPGTGDTRSLLSLLFGLGGLRRFADFPIASIAIEPAARRLGEVADLDTLLGFKGNYMMFPLKESNALTEHMMQDYVGDDVLGVLDPDDFANFTVDELAAAIRCARDEGTLSGPELTAAEDLLLERLVQARRDSEEIIVPTGQLFIEALPGEHAVLEDFKLVHRQLDAEKVDAETRFAYLEAIRAAGRLTAGERNDPNVDRLIQVTGGTVGLDVDTE